MAEKLNSLEDLFIHELKDLYTAEAMTMEAMPKMLEHTSSSQLKEVFQQHMEETKQQHEKLNKVFEVVGQKPEHIECKGIEGILQEGEEILKCGGDPKVLDAALIGAAQKVEHYEIAGYGTARTHARMLGHNEAVTLLQEILDQEGHTDHKLSALAEESINPKAAM